MQGKTSTPVDFFADFPDKTAYEEPKCTSKYLLAHKDDDQPGAPFSGNGTDESSVPKEEWFNQGILTIDVTCVSANIRYSQDISLLNEARKKLEQMIYRMCKSY